MTRWRREVNCSDLWSTQNNWLILCASSLLILRHRYILSCHDDACQMSNNQTSTWWILCLHFNTSGFNTGTSLGTLNHQHKDFVDPTLLFSSSPQVNIIPIIAKADTISKSELHKFKIKIMSELVSNGVQIYQFPTDDEAVSEINASMNVSHSRSLHL